MQRLRPSSFFCPVAVQTRGALIVGRAVRIKCSSLRDARRGNWLVSGVERVRDVQLRKDVSSCSGNIPYSHQLPIVVIEDGARARIGTCTAQCASDGDGVLCFARRQTDTGKIGKRLVQVQATGNFQGSCPGRNGTRHAENGRHTHATFVRLRLAAFKASGRASNEPPLLPWSVVWWWELKSRGKGESTPSGL